MNRQRWSLVAGIGITSAVLGYILRDVIYQVVIVPLAYLLWILYFYYSAIPQWALWTVLLAVLVIAVVWNLLPDAPARSPRPIMRREPEGEVEALVVWLMKARRGNYFKWQLANRMGRIVRRMGEFSGGRVSAGDEAVEKYLDAGTNYSFVDFPTPTGYITRPPQTPLDVDPRRVVDYLESLMEHSSDRSG